VTGLFCHRHPRTNVVSAPGRADTTSANLTPASGCQDHTTSPYTTTSLVRTLGNRSQARHLPCNPIAQDAAASTAFHPAFRDDHDTPLLWDGMAKVVEIICPTGKSPDALREPHARAVLRHDRTIGVRCTESLGKNEKTHSLHNRSRKTTGSAVFRLQIRTSHAH
jgi:hypothetical protein